jgi:hypothetical protein
LCKVYLTAYPNASKKDGRDEPDSWWFFKQNDFVVIVQTLQKCLPNLINNFEYGGCPESHRESPNADVVDVVDGVESAEILNAATPNAADAATPNADVANPTIGGKKSPKNNKGKTRRNKTSKRKNIIL